jgi:transcriptional regulator with XRE-family HTH domain
MRNSGTTVQSRQLGRHLRELRRQSGVSPDAVAGELRVHPSTLYRYESGAIVPRPPDVMALCHAYGADDRMRDALTALCKEAETPGWWHSYNGAIPKWFEPFVGLESAASAIRAYDAEAIPGLFQTRDYAEVMIRLASNPGDVAQTVEVRMERQRLLTRRNPPQLTVVLGEKALCAKLDQSVTLEQLTRLDEVSRLPNVSLRILPLGEVHPGLAAGQRFYLLAFPSAGRLTEPPLVYAESLTGAVYLDKPEELEAYEHAWQGILKVALTPGDSRTKISEYIARNQ